MGKNVARYADVQFHVRRDHVTVLSGVYIRALRAPHETFWLQRYPNIFI